MQDGTGTDESGDELNRRQLLKTVGVGAAGLVAATGTASAHQSKFFGCSQVCTDTGGNYAVVNDGDSYECRRITRASDRGNLPWDWGAYCYEAEDDEAIVGLIEEDVLVGDTIDDGECTLCLNPNNCAENYVSSAHDVATALNENEDCAPCDGEIVLGDDCEVYGSSGRPGGDRRRDGDGSGNGSGRGSDARGHDNGKKRGRGKDKDRGTEKNGRGKGEGRGHGKDKGRGHDDHRGDGR
jgi:hypothetical protein